jgi:hypothetical protein
VGGMEIAARDDGRNWTLDELSNCRSTSDCVDPNSITSDTETEDFYFEGNMSWLHGVKKYLTFEGTCNLT